MAAAAAAAGLLQHFPCRLPPTLGGWTSGYIYRRRFIFESLGDCTSGYIYIYPLLPLRARIKLPYPTMCEHILLTGAQSPQDCVTIGFVVPTAAAAAAAVAAQQEV